MIRSIVGALGALSCVLATTAVAQTGPAFEAGVAEVQDIRGAELGVGYRFAAGPLRLTPTLGAFVYEGDNERYSFDDSVNRCRDSTNGRFARTELCDNTAVSAFGRVEATLRFRAMEFGAGYRVDEADGLPYGTVSFDATPNLVVKLNGGADYVGLSLVLR